MARSDNCSIWRLETAGPGGGIVYGGAGGYVACFDVTSACETARRTLNSGWINGLAYCPERNAFAAATSRGALFLLEAESLETLVKVSVRYWLNGLAHLGRGRFLVTTAEGVVFMWNSHSERISLLQGRHADQVWNCAVTKDGKLAATAGGGGELLLWDLKRRRVLRRLSIGGHTLTAVSILESRKLVATVDMGGVLTLRDIDSGSAVSRFCAHDARAWSMGTSVDERVIVTAGADRRVALWDSQTLQMLQEHSLNESATACEVHPAAQVIVAGDRVGKIHLLRLGAVGLARDQPYLGSGAGMGTKRVAVFVNPQDAASKRPFSTALCSALDRAGVAYDAVDISDSPLRKQSLARLSGCPLFPQLYVDGKFVGGSEVVCEMLDSGAFFRVFSICPNRPSSGEVD